MVFLGQQVSGEGNVLHSSLFDTTDAVFVLLYSDCHCLYRPSPFSMETIHILQTDHSGPLVYVVCFDCCVV